MEKLTTKKGNSYWAMNGAYSKLITEIHDELVPNQGSAPTLHGEILRCFANLNYEYNNNGNLNALDYEKIDCPECDGSGYEEVLCDNCLGEGTIHDDDDEQHECDDCSGSGYINEDCSGCDGDCTIQGEVLIDERYDKYLDFLTENLLNPEPVKELRNFLVNSDLGYSKYKFSDEEILPYSNLGDEVGYTITNTENRQI